MKRLTLLLVTLVMLAPALASGQAGNGSAGWEVIDTWGQLPDGVDWESASAIDTMPNGNIAVLRRSAPYVFVLSPEGELLRTWADEEGMFRGAHGLKVDSDGNFWITDNADNFVQKFSGDGELLMTLGQRGVAGDNSATDAFDGPADVTIAPNGDVYIADGYRNARVVQFSSDGEFVRILGGVQGDAPGEFNLPHAVELDSAGRLIVADAQNGRLQVFDPAGNVVDEWTDFPAVPRGAMYITSDDTLYVSHVDSESVTIMRDGEVVDTITGLGGRPHGVTVGADGSVYVANTSNRTVKKVIRR